MYIIVKLAINIGKNSKVILLRRCRWILDPAAPMKRWTDVRNIVGRVYRFRGGMASSGRFVMVKNLI